MKNLQTIILAAGKGTRMKSDVPKILHRACGKPLIEYVLDVARAVDSLKIWVVIGHGSEEVRNFLGGRVKTVIQKKLLGTGDAVKTAVRHFKHFSGDVLILCGDTPLLNKAAIRRLIDRHHKTGAACTVLTAVVEDPKNYGRIIRDPGGKMTAIRETKDASEEERTIREINVGVYCFKSKDLLKGLKNLKVNPRKKEYYLTDVIAFLAEQAAVLETVTTEDYREGLGVNDREDLAFIESVMRERILKNWMRQGVTITDPSTTHIDADVTIGRDTTIRPFTVIESDVRIGERCVIGPFARIRPGTRIGNKVEVGNFAEVSRSSIGEGCFMKHFSFLGDAEVGSNVNIGAGVVTANFDGKNKNKTKIADNAFIGSDSILVAPVSIGRGATTGAGCVVPKGKVVPAGGIVVGIPARAVPRRKR